jgi:DNA-binding transcriptional ArsR family regulator
MPRARFNERKIQILRLLDGRWMTAREVAEACGIKYRTAQAHLLRYRRYGLVLRKGGEIRPGRGSDPYVYTISPLGRRRLSWG